MYIKESCMTQQFSQQFVKLKQFVANRNLTLSHCSFLSVTWAANGSRIPKQNHTSKRNKTFYISPDCLTIKATLYSARYTCLGTVRKLIWVIRSISSGQLQWQTRPPHRKFRPKLETENSEARALTTEPLGCVFELAGVDKGRCSSVVT